MAPTIIFVFFLSLLCVSFSLPIALDEKTVQQNSDITVLTEETMIDAGSILNLDKKTKLVQSLTTKTVLNAFESVKADHGKRVRRSVIISKEHCPDDRYPYGNRCLTKEEFDEVNDATEGADDYVDE